MKNEFPNNLINYEFANTGSAAKSSASPAAKAGTLPSLQHNLDCSRFTISWLIKVTYLLSDKKPPLCFPHRNGYHPEVLSPILT